MENQAFALLMDKLKDIKYDMEKMESSLDRQSKILSEQAIVLVDHTQRSTRNEIHVLKVEEMVKLLSEEQKLFRDHINSVDKWINIFKPTRKKMTNLAAFLAFVGAVGTFFTSVKQYVITIFK